MFPWLEITRPKRTAPKREAMFRREVEERAALLQRLGYSVKATKKRLHANVDWDFELEARPKHAAEIDKIVDSVYRRGGTASGPPSV